MDLVSKYRPSHPEDVVGNKNEVKKVVRWSSVFDPSMDPLILHGPPGIGKTTTAHAVAQRHDLSIKELNASDERSAGSLGDSLLGVVRSRSPDYRERLVIVDEADNLDRGGAKKVREALDEATQRVILIVNDLYDGVSRSIRDRCKIIEFDYVSNGELKKLAKRVLEAENIQYREEGVERLVAAADGDARGMLNDLQTAITWEQPEVSTDVPEGTTTFLDSDEEVEGGWNKLAQWFEPKDGRHWRIYWNNGNFAKDVCEYAISSGISYELLYTQEPPERYVNNAQSTVLVGGDVTEWLLFNSDEVYGWWSTPNDVVDSVWSDPGDHDRVNFAFT